MTDVELLEHLKLNASVWEVLEKASLLGVADWYVGAGAVCQTVWNVMHGFEPCKFIKDVDLVYFDSSDFSADAEQAVRRRVYDLLGGLSVPIDVTNQARVHQWYAEEFGFEIEPYQSLEDAIDSWPTTASAIGVRLSVAGEFEVYAPFGLADMDDLVVRPNKKLITKPIYESKARKWKQQWPKLTIVEW